MSELPKDFRALLPHIAAEVDDRPLDWMWVFDPTDGSVTVEHDKGRHPAEFHTHATMAPHVVHPERVQGYAYAIKGGWRVTDEDHKEVSDPFILNIVLKALRREAPAAPLPHVLYHGDPSSQ